MTIAEGMGTRHTGLRNYAMVNNLTIPPRADDGASTSRDGDEDEMGALGGDGEGQDSDDEEDNHGVSPIYNQFELFMQDVEDNSDDE